MPKYIVYEAAERNGPVVVVVEMVVVLKTMAPLLAICAALAVTCPISLSSARRKITVCEEDPKYRL